MSSSLNLIVIFICLEVALCSDINATADGRGLSIMIVGGVEAREHEYPFIVSFYRSSGPGVGHFCAGSIVEPGWVVTAAHCVTPADFKLVAGKHDLRKTERTEQTVSIEAVIPHPKYNPKTFENDLALVKVKPPFKFTDQVKSIKLPNAGFVVKGPVTVAGWGVTDESKTKGSPVLMKVTVNTLDDSDCPYPEFVAGKMICGGVLEGGQDACRGDSGGPLLCDGQKVDDTVCGLVSFGTGCARPGLPGVYTKVAALSNWVHQEIQTYTGPKGRSANGSGSTIWAPSKAVLLAIVVQLVILKIFQC